MAAFIDFRPAQMLFYRGRKRNWPKSVFRGFYDIPYFSRRA